MFFSFDLLFTLRANQTLAKLKCLSNFSSEYQNSYNCREKKQYSHKTSRFFMTTKYFRNLCRVRCIYIFMYWEMIKPKKPLLLEDVWHANYTCTWPEVNKGFVFFFLTSISWIHQNSEFREFVNLYIIVLLTSFVVMCHTLLNISLNS